MKVTPIIAPAIDWQSFIVEAHAALGRSPTAGLQMAGLKPGPLKTVIPALGELQREDTAAIPFLKGRDSDQVLSHLHVSFMVEAEDDVISRLCGQAWVQVLIPDDCRTLVVMTGSLKQWRELIVSSSRLHFGQGVREVVNSIHKCLIVAGLGDLFADCMVRKQPDGTIVLEPQKHGR